MEGPAVRSSSNRLAARFWIRNQSVPYICPPLADVGTTTLNSSLVVSELFLLSAVQCDSISTTPTSAIASCRKPPVTICKKYLMARTKRHSDTLAAILKFL